MRPKKLPNDRIRKVRVRPTPIKASFQNRLRASWFESLGTSWPGTMLTASPKLWRWDNRTGRNSDMALVSPVAFEQTRRVDCCRRLSLSWQCGCSHRLDCGFHVRRGSCNRSLGSYLSCQGQQDGGKEYCRQFHGVCAVGKWPGELDEQGVRQVRRKMFGQWALPAGPLLINADRGQDNVSDYPRH